MQIVLTLIVFGGLGAVLVSGIVSDINQMKDFD